MNKLTKNDIILKDGVFDIRDDFIINFDEYNISYKEFLIKYKKRWYNDLESFFETNIYYFNIPLLNITYKIMCPEIYSFIQWHLPNRCSKVLGWDYFINYFELGLLDSRIKNVFIDRKNRLDDEEFEVNDDLIICDIENECEHNLNHWKLFCEIENTLFLNIKSFDKIEFVNMNKNHFINNNSFYKSYKRQNKQTSYILKDKNTGYYKIGKSVNPLKREKTLQSEKPTLILVKKFKYNWESDLHDKYKSQRIRGEWFNLNKTQLKYICTHYE